MPHEIFVAGASEDQLATTFKAEAASENKLLYSEEIEMVTCSSACCHSSHVPIYP